MNSLEVIKALDLVPLEPEGGYFRQIYKSSEIVLHSKTGKLRPAMTSIYYLLDQNTFSAFHRLPSDEIYHFYRGSAVDLFLLDEAGKLETIKLGSNIQNGEIQQFLVPGNVWQASALSEGGTYALLGTTMSPGYDEQDFNLANKTQLLDLAPKHSEIIERLCRK